MSRASLLTKQGDCAEIGRGLLVFLAVEKQDAELDCKRLAKRILSFRLFADEDGKTNLSVVDVNGAILLVPQFTLGANTHKGNRPGFGNSAPPSEARRLFQLTARLLDENELTTHTGYFGEFMRVELVNEGPTTYLLKS